MPASYETEQLRAELERQKERLEWQRRQTRYQRERAEHEERRAAAYKGHLTRTKKRVAAGVCPCCKRSFENLKRHMKSKHPGYGHEEGL